MQTSLRACLQTSKGSFPHEMLVWDSYSKNGHWLSLKSELRGFEDLTALTSLLQMRWQVQNRLGQKSQHHPIIEACFLRKPVYNRQPVWWLARNFLTCSGELYQWGTEPKSQSFVASALILQRRWSASYLLALAPRKLMLWWKGQKKWCTEPHDEVFSSDNQQMDPKTTGVEHQATTFPLLNTCGCSFSGSHSQVPQPS